MAIETLYHNIISQIADASFNEDTIKSYFKHKSIRKKKQLILEGSFTDKLYFIERGLLFSYKTLNDGSLQVIQFAKENCWISDLYGFVSGDRALFSIQAIEDSELWIIDKTSFEAVCKDLPQVETFFRKRFQRAYLATLVRLSDSYSQDAQEKYQKIVDEQYDLLQRVPQYLIASYLGILPSSLSRIRNKK